MILIKLENLFQGDYGDILGLDRVSISKWERGVSIPIHEMLLKLRSEFNVTVNEILYGEKLNKENEEKINKVSTELFKQNTKNDKKIYIKKKIMFTNMKMILKMLVIILIIF